MKKIFAIFIFAISFALAGQVFAVEQIKQYDTEIRILPNSNLEITETILYDFGDQSRHGIYRDIPFKYSDHGLAYNFRLSNFEVLDEQGNSYQFTLSNTGRDKRVKIGNPDKLISGENVYIIKYNVGRALTYTDNYDEFYWNVIGDRWEVPISNVSVKIYFPGDVDSDILSIDCYAGIFGEDEKCFLSDAEIGEGEINFSSPDRMDDLGNSRGMTVLLKFKKGIVYEITRKEYLLSLLRDNIVLFFPIPLFLFLFILWWKKGRDPKGRGTIIVQFDSPNGLSPLEIGAILNESVSSKDVSAQIINLAILGYVKISRVEKKVLFIKQEDYLIEKLKDDNDLDEINKSIMHGLFRDKMTLGKMVDMFKGLDFNEIKRSFSSEAVIAKVKQQVDSKDLIDDEEVGDIVKLSDLSETFYKTLESVKKKVLDKLTKEKYFPRNPRAVMGKYIFSVVIFIFIPFVALLWFVAMSSAVDPIIFIAESAITFAITILFVRIMPVKTKKGVLAREYILGLKKYLENAPEKNPKHFEKLLPYAMALGVEKKWADKFVNIYKEEPSWYSDPYSSGFSVIALSSGMSNFNSQAQSAVSSRPSSSSSGRWRRWKLVKY